MSSFHVNEASSSRSLQIPRKPLNTLTVEWYKLVVPQCCITLFYLYEIRLTGHVLALTPHRSLSSATYVRVDKLLYNERRFITVTCHRMLFDGLALRWVGVNTRPVHVGFLVNKIALARVFFVYFGFSLRISVHHGFLLILSSSTDVNTCQELIALFSHNEE